MSIINLYLNLGDLVSDESENKIKEINKVAEYQNWQQQYEVNNVQSTPGVIESFQAESEFEPQPRAGRYFYYPQDGTGAWFISGYTDYLNYGPNATSVDCYLINSDKSNKNITLTIQSWNGSSWVNTRAQVTGTIGSTTGYNTKTFKIYLLPITLNGSYRVRCLASGYIAYSEAFTITR